MRTRLTVLTLLLLLVLAAPASATIVPNKGMAGVELGDCIKHAVAVLGYPTGPSARTTSQVSSRATTTTTARSSSNSAGAAASAWR
jgi:hypothetical protein